MRHIVLRTVCSVVFLLISDFFDALYHLDCQLGMIAVFPFQNVSTTLFAIRGVTIYKVVRRRNFPNGNESFYVY